MGINKLKIQIIRLNILKQNYIARCDDEIYSRLNDIASMKYLKDDEVKTLQENFFVDFIINGKEWNNYNNSYSLKKHTKLMIRRRKVDPDFLIDIDVDNM